MINWTAGLSELRAANMADQRRFEARMAVYRACAERAEIRAARAYLTMRPMPMAA